MLKLRLYTSNRMENLAESLAEASACPCGPPSSRRPSWCRARGWPAGSSFNWPNATGSAAIAGFLSPAPSATRRSGLLPGLPEEAAYEPEVLVWRIMKHLPGFLGQPGFEPLKNYLGAEQEAGSCSNWQTASPTFSISIWSSGPTWSGNGSREPVRTGRPGCGARSAPRSGSSIRRRCRPGSSSTSSRPPPVRACRSGLPSSESRRCRPFTCGFSPRWPAISR